MIVAFELLSCFWKEVEVLWCLCSFRRDRRRRRRRGHVERRATSARAHDVVCLRVVYVLLGTLGQVRAAG